MIAKHQGSETPNTREVKRQTPEVKRQTTAGWPIARVMVIAAWRPVPNLCEWLDEFSYERQRPWLPLMLEFNVLRLGPIVVPGASCWGCWVKRYRQHVAWPNEISAVLQHYCSHADEGPRGYLEPFAMMGATQIHRVIDELDRASATPGYIWQIDMMTRKITTSRVIGVHDCPRCGLHRSPATRSYLEMQMELTHLWAHPTRE